MQQPLRRRLPSVLGKSDLACGQASVAAPASRRSPAVERRQPPPPFRRKGNSWSRLKQGTLHRSFRISAPVLRRPRDAVERIPSPAVGREQPCATVAEARLTGHGGASALQSLERMDTCTGGAWRNVPRRIRPPRIDECARPPPTRFVAAQVSYALIESSHARASRP